MVQCYSKQNLPSDLSDIQWRVPLDVAKAAKFVTGTSKHIMDINGNPFLSDIKEDEAIIKEE